jgi:hypothetical protein
VTDQVPEAAASDPKAAPDAEHRKWFEERFGQEAFLVLSNLLRFNINSRRLLANAEYNNIYAPLAKQEGELAKVPTLQRRLMLDAITLDLLSKVMASVEDFGKVLIALGKSTKEMPGALINATQLDSLQVFERLKAESDSALQGRFDLWDPARYGIGGEDAIALRDYNRIFVQTIRDLLAVVAEFVTWHEFAYNKYKHGNSVVMAPGDTESAPAEGFSAPIGVFTDHTDLSKMRFVLGGERVIRQFFTMQTMVVDMARALVERRLQLSEFAGVPLPLLCEGVPQPPSQTKYTPLIFGTVPSSLWPALERIWQAHLKKADYVRIELKVVTGVDNAQLQERVDYYNREWNPTVAGKIKSMSELGRARSL